MYVGVSHIVPLLGSLFPVHIVEFAVKLRRSRFDLILDVLGATSNGVEKPTRIMYEANLSWKTMNEILSLLVSQGLIDEIDMSRSRDKRNSRAYKITKKGETIIRYYANAERLIKIDEPARSSHLIS